MIEFWGHDHGTATIIGRSGREHRFKTLQCGHCGGHQLIIPGSGKLRGVCQRGCGFLCGAKDCMERCEHWEKKLEKIEAKAQRHE